MPESRLWLVNSNGNVFTAATTRQFLEQLPKSPGSTVCLKRLSVCQHSTWGVGHNHQVYVYVFGSEVPIRVKDATYENQRWTPGGFSGRKLLRTDRRSWSDEHGYGYLPKDSFELPSPHWQWEGDWTVDSNVRDEMSVDRMGWLYAGNFTGTWSTECHWNSLVRKRKWIRFRRFVSTNMWAEVPDEEVTPNKECFIDIAIGGTELSNLQPGHICVWAITHMGTVYYRKGVWRDCPEGTAWVHVPLETRGVVNITVGPTGLVWAVTWDGQAIVRTGVSRNEPYGTSWVEVPYPREDVRLSQVSIGFNALWALSRDGKVWYRKGIQGRDFETAAGSTWVEMVGEMSFISVSPNDQVFAIGQNNGHVYFRTGVSSNDLGGKTWQHITLEEDRSMHRGDSSGSDMSRRFSSGTPPSDDNLSWSGSFALPSPTGQASPSFLSQERQFSQDDVFVAEDSSVQFSLDIPSAGGEDAGGGGGEVDDETLRDTKRSGSSLPAAGADQGEAASSCTHSAPSSEAAATDSSTAKERTEGDVKSDCDTKSLDQTESSEGTNASLSACQPSSEQRKSPSAFCDDNDLEEVPDTIYNFVTDLLGEDTGDGTAPEKKAAAAEAEGKEGSGAPLQDQARKEGDLEEFLERSGSGDHSFSQPMISMMTPVVGPSSGRMSDTSELSSQGPAEMMVLTPAMPRFIFVWLSASACVFDNAQSVPWLQAVKEAGSSFRSKNPGISHQLRKQILKQLHARNQRETRAAQGIPAISQAVEQTAWVKKAAMQWLQDDRSHWTDCHVELDTGQPGTPDGYLTIHYTKRHKQLHRQVALSDVTCVRRLQDPLYRTVLAVHLMEPDLTYKPIYLRAASESEAEEWVASLYLASMSLQQPVPVGSLWCTTLRGDVFVHFPGTASIKPYQMQWCPVGGHLQLVVSSPCGVTWALGYDHTPWAYSGGYGGGIFSESSNMSRNVSSMSDARVVAIYEMQQWYPVVGYCSKGFLTEGAEWGDVTGRREQTKEEVKLPSRLWHWVGEWTVDFEAPGGVDADGWQYASNINRPFHPGKGLRDGVRRRRWLRKCKLATCGPWLPCPKLQLRDISLQVDLPSQRCDPLVVWAVIASGDVVCRRGVSMENPLGDEWDFVETPLPIHSVSVGGNYRVWALAKNGSAWYRPGVSPSNPKGSRWLQVVPPPNGNSLLRQISVGGTAVWAVDDQGNLWYRQEITPTFPEGTRWTYVCNRVQSVSVGPANQVWIVSGSNFGRNRHREGVIYKRLGISDNTPTGSSWEPVIGCGWKSISIRGLRESQDIMENSG